MVIRPIASGGGSPSLTISGQGHHKTRWNLRENYYSPCDFSTRLICVFKKTFYEICFLTLFSCFFNHKVAVSPLPFAVAGQLGIFCHHPVRGTAVYGAHRL